VPKSSQVKQNTKNHSKVCVSPIANRQCWGSGMFIPDPDFYPSRIQDLGSKNSNNKREGWKFFFFSTLFCSHKYQKIWNYFIFELIRKNFGPIYKNYWTFYPKNCHWQKYGFGIRDPRSGINLLRIPDPEFKRHRIPDPQHCKQVDPTQSAGLIESGGPTPEGVCGETAASGFQHQLQVFRRRRSVILFVRLRWWNAASVTESGSGSISCGGCCFRNALLLLGSSYDI
jgi:hypothetical protein